MDLSRISPLKLNLGAGRRAIDGFLSVDLQGEPDIRADVRSLPMIRDGIVDEALTVHVLEHFYRWEAPAALAEWFRILLNNPDLRAGVWGLFGDPKYQDPIMVHRWCWSAEELGAELQAAGFIKIRKKEPVYHKKYRDMRIECRKPEAS
jgi:predicted SAM-dependent methyltransferase